MNIRKETFKLFACMSLFAIAMSCESPETETFNGDPFVFFTNVGESISVNENAGESLIELGITMAYSTDVSVEITVVDDTAIQGVDYAILSSTVIIPAGEYSGNFSITPFDNAEFNASKFLTIEITSVSVSGVKLGHANETSTFKNVIIVNDDCPTQSSLWWGNIDVEDVGYGFVAGVGSANMNGDCDVLLVTADLPNSGIGEGPFELFFTPSFLGATSGSVDVPSQLYCTACSAGLDGFYSATGTYDETTGTIVLFYSFDRSDGANFFTGTNIITLQ